MKRSAPTIDGAAEARRCMQACIQESDPREAWRHMCRALAIDSTTATCEAVAAALESLDAPAAGLAELRVALLTNFTVEPLVPLLVAHGAASGLAIRPYVPAYDTWAQEAVDPDGGLRRQDPDLVIVHLRLEVLAPRLAGEFLALSAADVDEAVNGSALRIEQALRAIREWSPARLVVNSFPSPVYPTLGILDDSSSGQTAAVKALNDRLVAMSAEIGNLFIIDTDRVRARVGETAWHDARLWAIATLPYGPAALHALAEEYLRVLRAVAGRTRKVLVLDADETLWGGVLGEVGAAAVRLGGGYPGSAFVELQRVVLEWHRRGVVLGLISKNEEGDVLAMLDQHPDMLLRAGHFSAMRINWQDKAANLVDLADELGLALDAIVYVDDSSVECDRMRQALPEVLTVQLDGEPAERPSLLKRLGVFDSLTYGADDRERGARYRAETERRTLQRNLPSLDEFHASLDMAVTVEPVVDATLARAADLTQRTNQFNLNPRRLTAEELKTRLAAPGCEGFLFRLRDRFGDYGIIGLGLLEERHAETVIAQFLLSCRVLQRTVEDTALAFLVERARGRGARDLLAYVSETRRNGLARAFIASRGFEPSAAVPDGTLIYRLPADRTVTFARWVPVLTPVTGSCR